MKHWRRLLEEFRDWLWKIQWKAERPTEVQFMRMLEEARQEWISAKAYFDNVTEIDLIDHAIYTMDAAEQRYSYLLKKAKAERLQAGQLRLA